MSARFLVGVDVGGTFTDVFVLDRESGSVRVAKTPSTLDDQSRGFVAGIGEILDSFDDIDAIVHGTTTGTNALLERKGAKAGIITTNGFRDVLEMRRRDRPTTWGLRGSFEPVVPRKLRLEVRERVLADGSILEDLDEPAVRASAQELLRAGCQSVCVFFINGYANTEHERRAVEIVREEWPNAYVTAATEILPEIREFERLSTAALNAYLQPITSSYLDRLEQSVRSKGFGGEVFIIQSNGGVMALDTARNFPVRTALSGPAAGVKAAQVIADAAGFENVVTCDMGGTSFDVSLISSGEAALSPQAQIDFGMVIRTPMIEITTIGAGGGSIAWIDDGGMLQIGPESAGSEPGPVCYGLGNDRPTVTDANLVLGRINPERPIGGRFEKLDLVAASQSLQDKIAEPLGLNVKEAAEAVLRVANAKMAGAIRLVSIERGHDPARFVAMPFGGGGALHAGALIQEVGLKAAVVPRFPGVTSALGCVVADMRHDRVQTVNRLVTDVDPAALGREIDAAGTALAKLVERSGIASDHIELLYELDMLYVGQTHTVNVAIQGTGDDFSRESIERAFDDAYQATYGRLLTGIPQRIVNFRVTAIGRRPAFDMTAFAPSGGELPAACVTGEREIFAGGASAMAKVYDRLRLEVGAEISGPAILEQADATIFVDPGLTGVVDRFGNLIIAKAARNG